MMTPAERATRSVGREKLEWNRGGGCLIIAGFPFLLAGLVVLGMVLRLVPVQGGQPPLVVLLIIGFACAGTGIFLMLAREKVVLDRGQDLVARGWRLIVPVTWRQHRLNDFRRVLLRGNAGRDRQSSDEFYTVSLERVYAGKDFVIEESGSYLAARQTAERAARFLKFPLSDTSTGGEVLRQPEHLDEPYRSRVKRQDERIVLPAPPAAMTAKISEQAGRLTIEIPPPGHGSKAWLRLLPPLVFSLAAFYFFSGFLQLPMPSPLRVLFFGFFGFFILMPILSGLRDVFVHTRRAERLTLTDDLLLIERRRGLRWKKTEMRVDAIEDIHLPEHPRLDGVRLPGGKLMLPENYFGREDPKSPSPGDLGRGIVIGRRTQAVLSWIMKVAPGPKMTFLTDQAMESFGTGLGPEEMAYIDARVRRFMAGPSSSRP